MKKVNLGKLKDGETVEVRDMAMDRPTWSRRVQKALEGALGEYAKFRYAELIGYKGHDWIPEVGRLLKKVERLRDKTITKINGKGDRKKAYKEAFTDASSAQDQVTAAKNEIASKLTREQYKTFGLRIKKSFDAFDSENLIVEMVTNLAPTLKP